MITTSKNTLFDKSVFGSRLKQIRESIGKTQQDVSDYLGDKHNNISNYEIGYACPTLERFRKLCLLYGVSADTLLMLDELPPRIARLAALMRDLDDTALCAVEALVTTLSLPPVQK